MSEFFINDELREQLIIAIESYPCLCDVSRDSYHHKLARTNAWREIATVCGIPGKEEACKLAWKRLKEKYKRQKDKMQGSRSGDPGTVLKPWFLYDTMSFIDPFIQARSTSSNFMALQAEKPLLCRSADGNVSDSLAGDAPEVTEVLARQGQSPVQDEVASSFLASGRQSPMLELSLSACTPSPSVDAPVPASLTKRRKAVGTKRKAEDFDRTTTALLNAVQSTHFCEDRHSPEEDSTDHFFKYLCLEAKKLSEETRPEVLLQMMQLMQNAVKKDKANI